MQKMPRKLKTSWRNWLVAGFLTLPLMLATPSVADTMDEVQSLSQLAGPVSALSNTANRYSVPATFCTSAEKAVHYQRLGELSAIADKHIAAINQVLQKITRLETMPIGGHYTQAAQPARQLLRKLRRIKAVIRVKVGQLSGAQIIDCSTPTTIPAVFEPESEPVDPLAGITIYQANYRELITPGIPVRICSEDEKMQLILAVASVRTDAAMNMNQADQVIWSIKHAMDDVETPAGQTQLAAMLAAARQDLEARIAELDALDALYEFVQTLEVEDCTGLEADNASLYIHPDPGQLIEIVKEARQQNPYDQEPEIILPRYNGFYMGVLYQAEYMARERQRAVERAREQQHRNQPRQAEELEETPRLVIPSTGWRVDPAVRVQTGGTVSQTEPSEEITEGYEYVRELSTGSRSEIATIE